MKVTLNLDKKLLIPLAAALLVVPAGVVVASQTWRDDAKNKVQVANEEKKKAEEAAKQVAVETVPAVETPPAEPVAPAPAPEPAPKPAPAPITKKTEPKPAETKPAPVKIGMNLVSSTLSGTTLQLTFSLAQPVTGKCKGWIKNSNGESLYQYTEISNATSCTVNIDVTGKSGSWTGYGYLKDSNYTVVGESGAFGVSL